MSLCAESIYSTHLKFSIEDVKIFQNFNGLRSFIRPLINLWKDIMSNFKLSFNFLKSRQKSKQIFLFKEISKISRNPMEDLLKIFHYKLENTLIYADDPRKSKFIIFIF